MSTLLGLLAVALCFGFIILVHEMGHFLTARWAGVRCPQFAIGFGPRLGGFSWKGTDFAIRGLPFGGYVLMVGEDPAMDGGASWQSRFASAVPNLPLPATPAQALAHMAQPPDPDVKVFLESLPPDRLHHTLGDLMGVFTEKSAWQKTVILLGGVFMNLVSATLLFVGLALAVGLGGPRQLELRVGKVMPDSPAALSGLPVQSTLLSLDGAPTVGSENFIDMMRSRAGENVRVSVRTPAGEQKTFTVTPDLSVDGVASFRAGKPLQMISAAQVPGGATMPFPVTRVNGQAVGSLAELRSLILGLKKRPDAFQLEGPSGKCELKVPAGEEKLEPRGVMGAVLAPVDTLAFEREATSDVVAVAPGSQAERMGIKAGDELQFLQGVLVVGGKSAIEQVLAGMSQRPASANLKFEAVLSRGPQKEEVVLTSPQPPAATAAAFGVELQPLTTSVRVSKALDTLGGYFSGPFQLIHGLITNLTRTFGFAKEQVRGPLGIMQTIYEVSHRGLPELLWLLGILNTAVAAMNLLPIPALDGARCLFVWAGALRGRIINPDKEARIHFAGILVLLTLALLVTYQDTSRLLGGMFSGR